MLARVQVKGQATLDAPRGQVWNTLMNADALQGCLPGCERFVEVGPLQWEATMTVGLAGIKGTYNGKVSIADQQPETSYRLNVEGAGSGNRLRGSGLITLEDTADGKTAVTYDGDAQIGGTIAVVGQRLFQPAARMLADQFFKCMGSKVTTT